MTSPPGSSPAPIEGSTPPSSGYANMEAHGMKLSVPKWVSYVAGIIVTLSAGIPLFSQVLIPMVQEFTATSRAEKAKADKEAAILRADKDKIEQELIEVKEYQKHYGKKPTGEREFFNSPADGLLRISYFEDDRCLQVTRREPGHNQAEKTYWVIAKSIPYEAPPGQIEGMRQSLREETPRDQPFLNAAYQFASFTPAGASFAPTRACADPHPGPFQPGNGQQNGCWLQVWRRWPDGCQHYQWFNTCNGYWDNHPNGAPRVYWTNCVH
jgi:hypothetical protein